MIGKTGALDHELLENNDLPRPELNPRFQDKDC
jgi:hypothetical protein